MDTIIETFLENMTLCWVLPSLCSMLVLLITIRQKPPFHCPEEYDLEDWTMLTGAALLWPVAVVVYICMFLLPALVKERSFKRRRRV